MCPSAASAGAVEFSIAVPAAAQKIIANDLRDGEVQRVHHFLRRP
jgi:hypothetical protein